jgi:hypothetical protein
MANTKISALTSATTPLAGTEVLPIVQSSTTVKVAVSDLTAGRSISVSGLTNTGLTASKPVFTDASKVLTSTGVVPVANGGTNASAASITAFNNITGYTASGATGTTSTNLVFSTSPSITTPTLVGDVNLSTGNLTFSTAAKGIFGSSPFSVSLGNGVAGTILDLSVAMPAGSTGIVNVYGASAGKATILCQRDQGGYYSVTELGTQPRGTYITSISLSGTNLRITNSTGGSETFSGRITLMI